MRYGAIVIGAGVVGLACARALALAGRDVLVLERNAHFGEEISSRNSEVIHAGIYYPAGSLKAALCVDGRHRLYRYCRSRHIPHRRLGKLIVATQGSEKAALDAIRLRGEGAGVDNLELLDQSELARREPALRGVAALFSPDTGIIDSHSLMASLVADIEDFGGQLVCNARVERILALRGDWGICIPEDPEPVVSAPLIVNAAGLSAQAVAARIEGSDPATIPPQYLARGRYFAYAGKVPFGTLVYPVPVAGGLGVHLTLDLTGNARFGPDVRWIDAVDYRCDEDGDTQFAAAISRYWPALDATRLHPGFCGIRPKIAGPGAADADFAIVGEESHGLRGIINLYGIESPGLTASLAIGELVASHALNKVTGPVICPDLGDRSEGFSGGLTTAL